MKSPLVRRLPKELKRDFKKYLIIFLILFLTIGFVSGMFVANNSMLEAGQNAFAKYNVEDGHFNLSGIPTQEMITEIEAEGVKLGRPKGRVSAHHKLTGCDNKIKMMLAEGYPKSLISKQLNVSPSTLYLYLKENKSQFQDFLN